MKRLPCLVYLLLSAHLRCEASPPRFFSTIKSFGFEEKSIPNPNGDLCLGSDGRLYGFGAWTVIFSIAADGSDPKVIHRDGPTWPPGIVLNGGLLELSDGRLYGFGTRGLYSLNRDGTDFRSSTNQSFQTPSKLIEGSNGLLYGTFLEVGNLNAGIFSVERDGSKFRVLRNFATNTANAFVSLIGPLVEMPDGGLAGVVETEPRSESDPTFGQIYRIDLNGENFRILTTITNSNSASIIRYPFPASGLVIAQNRLVGRAGIYGAYFLYSCDFDGANFQTATLNADAQGELFSDPAGKIHGTTYSSLFEVNPDGTGYRNVDLSDPHTGFPIHPTGSPKMIRGRWFGWHVLSWRRIWRRNNLEN